MSTFLFFVYAYLGIGAVFASWVMVSSVQCLKKESEEGGIVWEAEQATGGYWMGLLLLWTALAILWLPAVADESRADPN